MIRRLRVTEESLAAYRERATNVWALVRWAGVVLIILGLGVAVTSRGAAWEANGTAAALGLTIAGWVAIGAAIWMRRRDHRRMGGGR